jgi:hypothetical protein
LGTRKENNRSNEKELVESRLASKEGKNPWDVVIANIELKESNYKGTKNVSRMRDVIINRKSDFVQLHMQ